MAPARALSNDAWEFEYSTGTRTHGATRRFVTDSVRLGPLDTLEGRLQVWLAAHSITVTRIALGVIFFWFGLLKFLPGPMVTAELAGRTVNILTLGVVPAHVAIHVLAVWECAIGVGLLMRRCLRTTIALLALQMSGSFMPLVLFPAASWTHSYVPTLQGQYIIKNIVLIAAGVLLAATMQGGRVVPPLTTAPNGTRRQAVSESVQAAGPSCATG
jgi:uncharacterized membrane protein YkgB